MVMLLLTFIHILFITKNTFMRHPPQGFSIRFVFSMIFPLSQWPYTILYT